MNKWMSIDEAAKYIGIGKTVLYSYANNGEVPCNKIGQKWLFESEAIDAWIKANKPIDVFFTSTTFNIVDNPQLREPQVEAYQNAYDYFKAGNQKAIIQIPVGCGKSGLAALLPLGISNGRVLVVAPNLTIKNGLVESFDITNYQKCFWRARNVLQDKDMLVGPYVCTLDTGNPSISDKSHVVVTNVQQLSTNPEKWLKKFSHDYFDMIIVDEAHHSPADSWKQILFHFPNAKVVNMTATPFRSDKQEIEGELIFRYPFKKATMKGYVKHVTASYVAPEELEFVNKGKTQTYNLEEVLKLKEKDWFSRGIALSDVCNQHIVDNSLKKLEELRETGTFHQLIAVACSIDHAKTIRSMYEERGYKSSVIHSDLQEEEKSDILRRLKSGELDCIIQVQMLGEGFDHQKLSVAAIFRPFRSLAPYIQFVGRILRVIVQNNPNHPDNYGHIVTHAGMNLDQRLKEFKLFEKDDQKFWEDVIGGKEPSITRNVETGKSRTKNSESMFVDNEIVESLIEEDFSTADDEDLISELESKLESLGLDPSGARDLILGRKVETHKKTKAAEPFSILPQRKWEQLKKRLNEKVNRSANMLLNKLELERAGRKFAKLGIPATNDYVACVILINKEIKKRNKKDRKDWAEEEFTKAVSELDEIIDALAKEYKEKINGKKR